MPKEYVAFISYSRANDTQLSIALHRTLRKFAKPWYGLSQRRVFRDQESLGAGNDLTAALEGALDRSKFLILVASPEAGKSKHVNSELEYWLGRNDLSTVLVVLSDGEIGDDPREIRSQRVLPCALRSKLTTVPLYVDLRWARGRSDAEITRTNEFNDAIATLLSPIDGVEKSELHGDERRERSKFARVRNSIVVSLVGLLSLTVGALFLYSTAQQDLIESQELQAVAQSDVIRNQRAALGEAALRAARNGDVRQAAQLATSALSGADAPVVGPALAALYELRKHPSPLRTYKAGSTELRALAVSTSLSLVAVGFEDGHVSVFDRGTGYRRMQSRIEGSVAGIAFIPGSKELVAVGSNGSLTLIDTGSGAEKTVTRNSGFTTVTAVPSGTRLYTGDTRGVVVEWTVEPLQPVRRYRGLHSRDVVDLEVSSDGETITGLSRLGDVCVWRVGQTQRCMQEHKLADSLTLDLAANPSTSQLIVAKLDGDFVIWQPESHEIDIVKGGTGFSTSAAFDVTGSLFAGASGQEVTVWSTSDWTPQVSFAVEGSLLRLKFADDTNNLFVSTAEGTVSEWKIGTTAAQSSTPSSGFKVKSHDSFTIATVAGSEVSIVDGREGTVVARGLVEEDLSFIDWSGDTELVMIGGASGTIYLWRTSDAQSPQVVATLGEEVAQFAKSRKDGTWFYRTAAGAVGLLKRLPNTWAVEPLIDGIEQATFSENSMDMVAHFESGVTKWFSIEDTVQERFTFPDSVIGPFAFQDNGVVAASEHGTILTISRNSVEPTTKYRGHVALVSDIAVSPTGLVSSSIDGTVRFWQDGSAAVFGPENVTLSVIATDPSGSLAAVGSNDGRVWLRHLETGVLLDSFHSNDATDIVELQFFGGGRKLASRNSNHTLELWDTQPLGRDLIDWYRLKYSSSNPGDGNVAAVNGLRNRCQQFANRAQLDNAVPTLPIIVEADYRGPIEICEMAVEQNPDDTCTLADLGVLLRTTTKGAERGYRFIEQAAAAGCKNALDHLYQIRTELTFTAAARQSELQDLEAMGSSRAAVELLKIQRADNLADPLLAIRALEELAESGNPWAHVQLSEYSLEGILEDSSNSKAIYHYTIAAELLEANSALRRDTAEFLQRRGNLLNDHDYEQALAAYRKGLIDAAIIKGVPIEQQ